MSDAEVKAPGRQPPQRRDGAKGQQMQGESPSPRQAGGENGASAAPSTAQIRDWAAF